MSNVNKFLEICQSKTELLTEDSIKGIDLNAIKNDIIPMIVRTGNKRNYKFLVLHGVEIENIYLNMLDDYTGLENASATELALTCMFDRVCDNFSFKDPKNELDVLIKLWKKSKHEGKHEENDIVSRNLKLFRFGLVDFLMKELVALADLKFISHFDDSETDGKHLMNVKTLVEKYHQTGKILNCSDSNITDMILTNFDYPEVVEYLYSINYITKELGLKHFICAHEHEFELMYGNLFSKRIINEALTKTTILAGKMFDINSLNNDLINVYIKHGLSKSDINIDEFIDSINKYYDGC